MTRRDVREGISRMRLVSDKHFPSESFKAAKGIENIFPSGMMIISGPLINLRIGPINWSYSFINLISLSSSPLPRRQYWSPSSLCSSSVVDDSSS